MNAVKELITLYNMTPSGDIYHDISEIMLRHLPQLKKMSINQIAELCFTSKATLSRLARKLGFDSFAEFRANVTTNLANYPSLNHSMPPIESINYETFILSYLNYLRSMLDKLEDRLDPSYFQRVNSAMHNADTICLYSNQAGDFPMSQLQYDLVMAGKKTVFLQNLDDQLANARTLDSNSFILICLPNSVESAPRIEVLRIAKEQGATIVLIKPKSSNIGMKYADYLIDFDDSRTAMDGYIYDVIISLLSMNYRYNYLS